MGPEDHRSTVLVIEDDPVTAAVVARTLGHDHEVLVAADGGTALDLAARQPHCVLLDLVLPDMDGEELLARLRRLPGCAEIPAIVVSGAAEDPQRRLRLLESAAHDVMGKPFHPAELRLRVRNAVRARMATERLHRSEQRYRTLVAQLPETFVLVFDRELRFLLADGQALRTAGIAAAEIEGRRLPELLDAQQVAEVEPAYRAALAGELRPPTIYPLGDRRFSCRYVPLPGSDGRILGAMVVGNDITEQIESRRVLEERTRALERSNSDLERFASVCSHDLAEPLRVVNSYAELLERRFGAVLEERGQRYLGHITGGATRMQQLIDDLLAYSRIDGRPGPPVRVETRAVVGDVLDDLAAAIAEHRAEVSVGELPAVTADAAQLRQVFQNLIANALKFTAGAPARVRVGARPAGEGAWAFDVADEGIGIDPAQHQRIFEVFQRLHTREEVPGSGIGLAICRRVVERHGGRLTVQSSPGAGSTFTFTLPAAASA